MDIEHFRNLSLLGIYFLINLLFSPSLFTFNHILQNKTNDVGWNSPFGWYPLDGSVFAIASTNDENIYIGGNFQYSGNLRLYGIGRWDGKNLNTLGEGLTYQSSVPWVYALSNLGNDLYVAGRFTRAGNLNSINIAKWNGVEWIAEGGFVLGTVRSLKATSNGIYVGGNVNTAGYTSVNNIAMWNGMKWENVGGGIPGNDVMINTIVEYDGKVYVGGYFNSIGDMEVNNIAVWDGSEWSFIGTNDHRGVQGEVFAIAKRNGNLYIGGEFEFNSYMYFNNIAIWDGESWKNAGAGFSEPHSQVRALHFYNDYLYAGGSFQTAGTTDAKNIARWDGYEWSAVNTSKGNGVNGTVYSLHSVGDDLYVGGDFSRAGGEFITHNIAIWTGSTWYSLSGGILGSVHTLSLYNDKIIAGGDFTTAGRRDVNNIGLWDGRGWHGIDVNGTYTGVSGTVQSVDVSGDTIFIGGSFSHAGDIEASNAAYWDGSAWNTIAENINHVVYSILSHNQYLYIGGSFTAIDGVQYNNIAKFDKFTGDWIELGTGLNGPVHSMCIDDSNNLVAGGNFYTAGGVQAIGIALWNGDSWSALTPQINGMVTTVACMENKIYAGGFFTQAGSTILNRIGYWDTATNSWHAMGNGFDDIVYAIAPSKNYIYAGGRFNNSNGKDLQSVARWNGTAWEMLDSGIDGWVYAITTKDDEIYFGGDIYEVNNQSSSGIARWIEQKPTSVSERSTVSTSFHLYQNFPNPFNSSTTITYYVPSQSVISITIYDILGRKIKELVNSVHSQGEHLIYFNADHLPSGIYFFELNHETARIVNKMTILR